MNHYSGFNFKRFEGLRFGRLLVKEYYGKGKHNNATWLCECDCGGLIVVPSSSLKSGFTKSCGCYGKEFPSHTKHGDKGKRLYITWKSMRERCNTKGSSSYHNYGGRGIGLCEEWDDYVLFKDWAMLNGYKEELTIERIDNNGNYCPENCRWATKKEQARNRRRNLLIKIASETKCFSEWCDVFKCDYKRAYQRMKRNSFPFYTVSPFYFERIKKEGTG